MKCVDIKLISTGNFLDVFNNYENRAEVKDLYSKDRTLLPLKDRDLFKLPLHLRKKQGTQQLMLWVKHAHLVFDHIAEQESTQRQVPITDWLSNWTEDITVSLTECDSTAIRKLATAQKQTDITTWLHSWDDDSCEDTNIVKCTINTGEQNRLMDDLHETKTTEENRKTVPNELNQGVTTNTCTLVQ